MPIYWLVATPVLLVLFIALSMGYVAGLLGHVCKKCQAGVCPANRNPEFK